MDQNNIIESGGFYFIHNFDSGNLGHVERVPTELIAPSLAVSKPVASDTPDYEFNLWTRPDCAGTEYENGNRTWFYFGVQANEPNVLVRLNLINLNKQGKMYSQGMAPVTRTLPGKPQWERIRDRPVHSVTDDNSSTLSFKYRTADNIKATTFFAFTYPFSFAELQIALNTIDLKILPLPSAHTLDDIYYCRECLVYSLEGRRVDLLTISSYHGISMDREERLKHLFPDNQERPYKFTNKKVIFMSARVHPGETPSSFVFNGFLNLLLTRHDPIALQLRKLYVFKMIPFLNPDGVARGHYRTDTRGVNLNRVYLNPSLTLHPTVYASRSLIRYYHFGCEKDDVCDDSKSFTSRSIQNISEISELIDPKKKKASNPKAESGKGDKSGTNSKAPSSDTQQLGTEASTLAEQVCDLKLGESPSSTSPSSPPLADTPSLLNESTLRTCLGSTVHLSTSEELNFQGANPLRPLRDTLKNSISLLMESNSSITADSLGLKDSRLNNLKMGWCRECRQNMAKAEDSIAASSGFGSSAPGRSELFHTYHNTIQEYREHQRKQLDDEQRRQLETTQHTDVKDDVHLCTNCFKKFAFNGSEEIRVADSKSTASVGVSAGDSGSVRDDRARRPPPGSTGDAAPEPPAVKEDKPKGGKARRKTAPAPLPPVLRPPRDDSGLYLYIDLHGHASKKGIFMYGNHFEDLDNSVECMLLPRIMSLNNLHFHFSSCNFTERNMYLKDRRDGMSREGSGRVAVLKATGLVRSYTLECNYNTGRMVNVLPPAVRDIPTGGGPSISAPLPPKYTPHVFEEMKHTRLRNLESFEEMDAFEVGRSLGASILDLTGHHPNSRVPCSEHRTLAAVRDWLRAHTKTMRPQQLAMSRLRARGAAAAAAGPPGGAGGGSPPRVAPFGRVKPKVTEERKENAYAAARPDSERKPVLGQRSGHDIIAMNVKYTRKPEAALAAARPKYLAESEPKPKSLAAKRRSVLAIRKPNGSKTQVGGAGGGGGGGVGKPRARRAADDSSPRGRASVGKRGLRGGRARPRCRAMASSSSDDMLAAAWEDVAGGTALQPLPADSLKRRVFPAPAPHLKKIRLKTAI